MLYKMLAAQKAAEEREDIIIYDEDLATVFRVQAGHAEISDTLPASCRWVPNYRLVRKIGAYAGLAIAGIALLFAVMAGIKDMGPPALSVYVGLTAVLLAGPLALAGWSYAPKYRATDYLPFSTVRRVTRRENEEPPHNAWSDNVDTDDGRITYIVPYAHSFLNLANPEEEMTGEVYHPFVARASVLYKDSQMEDVSFLMSSRPDTWSKIKSLTLFGVIGVELIFLFLMLAVITE